MGHESTERRIIDTRRPAERGAPPRYGRNIVPAPLRVLVLGIGGIGGVIAARLLAQGVEVCPVSRNPAVAQAVSSRGFVLTGVGIEGEERIPGLVFERIPPNADPFDIILLATQPNDIEAAARQALPHLAPGGRVVTLPNGLPEERVARLLGRPDQVIGGIVGWGASHPQPGVFERTSEGGFVLGRLDGGRDPLLERLAQLLGAVGPVEISDNLRGARWSKLALNCAISSLGTLGGDRLGVLMRQRHVRRLALEVMSEVVAVAQAEGVRLQRIAGTIDLEWIALTDKERSVRGSVSLAAKHALLLVVGLKYRRLRSSMLAALERGRTPPVDFLNGEIADRAKAHGLRVPINRQLTDRVHDLAAGRRTPAHEELALLYQESRAAV